ncbi:MAG: DUF2029 domain-containing protein [Cyclobacteriaceae bacterium]|nr:DUF2029 domain-containing protein [Cyclobacteriaceae bacterium]
MKNLRSYWQLLFKNFIPVSIIYLIVVLAVSIQSWLLPPKVIDGIAYNQYNNYTIFKQSFFHLIHGQDLYLPYPHEQWDLYKYSPTFSIAFAPLAVLPDLVGLIIWNLLNTFVLLYAIRWLPKASVSQKVGMLFFVLVELITSLQNSQSNGLIAGLIILGFVWLEQKKIFSGILAILGTFFIKIFGLFALGMLLFCRNKPRMITSVLLGTIALFALPLTVISVPQLQFLYKSWWSLLMDDHSASYGLSVMGWLTSWFDWHPNKNVVVIVGLFLLCLPLVRWKQYAWYDFRITWLSSVLIWVVIFNHKAESPTFIIAATGAAMWYFIKPRTALDLVLIVLLFVFTTLSPTDIFPRFIQENYFDPYNAKVVPCIILWIRILIEILTMREEKPVVIAYG